MLGSTLVTSAGCFADFDIPVDSHISSAAHADGDEVTLQARVIVAGVEVPIVVVPATVVASATGAAVEVRWNAAAHLGDTGYRDDLQIRITAQDSTDRSPVAESPPATPTVRAVPS